jgi:hypothetical protein
MDQATNRLIPDAKRLLAEDHCLRVYDLVTQRAGKDLEGYANGMKENHPVENFDAHLEHGFALAGAGERAPRKAGGDERFRSPRPAQAWISKSTQLMRAFSQNRVVGGI